MLPRSVLHWVAALLAPLAVAACSGGGRSLHSGASSAASGVECAPFARQLSGVQLYGDAASWWDSAAGRYQRGSQPSPGAVLVFRRSGRLPSGHVSVVARMQSAREILVTHANWVHGHIARNEPVVDVSPDNDWSAVRVWWEPSGAMGATTYPTFGFIAPGAAPRGDLIAGR